MRFLELLTQKGCTGRLFTTHTFDPKRLRLREWARAALRVDDLKELHRRADLRERTSYEAMRVCSTELIANASSLKPMLDELFRSVVAPLFGSAGLSFQIPPIFRIHLDGRPPAFPFHKDRDYGMVPTRKTVWLPLTPSWGNNSIWIEDPDTAARTPLNLEYGEFAVFDSADIVHGSVTNDTGSSRVSFDCRFTPAALGCSGRQPTADSRQPTADSPQPTVHSRQFTADS